MFIRKSKHNRLVSDVVELSAQNTRMSAALDIVFNQYFKAEANISKPPRIYVPSWVLDAYEAYLPPVLRFEDVKARQDGYRNLMYRSTAICDCGC